MEVWTPTRGGAPIDDVLLHAARLALGVQGSAGVPAFVRVRASSPDVVRADMGILPATEMAALAHARHRARTIRADAVVRGDADTAGLDPAARENRLAADAPDFMGAAVRSVASAWSERADRALHDALQWSSCLVASGSGAAGAEPLQLDCEAAAREGVSNLQLRLGTVARTLRGRGVGVMAPDTAPAAVEHAPGGCAGRPKRRCCPRVRLGVVRATLRNPVARGLFLNDSLRPLYTKLPSVLAQVFLSLRSSHLIGDFETGYGDPTCPESCALCGVPVYSVGEDFGSANAVEHRWRHIEHLLLSCPCIVLPTADAVPAVAALRRDLLSATADDPIARRVVVEAFPPGPPDAAVAAVYSVPFLLDPVRSLRAMPGVCGVSVACCSRVVAAFLLGVACRVCGQPAEDAAVAAMPALCVPREYGVASLFPVPRSAAQDAVAADDSLVCGVCVCDLSAHRQVGAEADARLGRA